MLEALLRSRHAVCLVVTQPDKPRGRGRVPWAPPVKELALSCGVPVIQPESINRPEAVESLRAAAPDAIVVTAYGKRLARRVLALPRLGCFNAHASLLPKYRGAAPIERAILCGESETGVTLQRMAPELDAGAILAQRALNIGDEETAGELSARLSALAAGMIVPLLDAVESGAAVEQPQDAAQATEAPSLRKNDGLVPWRLDARGVCNFIRGMTPWPGAFTFHGLRRAAGAADPAGRASGRRSGHGGDARADPPRRRPAHRRHRARMRHRPARQAGGPQADGRRRVPARPRRQTRRFLPWRVKPALNRAASRPIRGAARSRSSARRSRPPARRSPASCSPSASRARR